MAFHIVTAIHILADSFGASKPRKGYELALEKIMLDMKMSDSEMQQSFRIALDEKKFPTVGEMRRIMERCAQHNFSIGYKRIHVLIRCHRCGYGYAIGVKRLAEPSEIDGFNCEGMIRIAPNKLPARDANYEFDKCEEVFFLSSLSDLWKKQGQGDSIVLPPVAV